METTDSRKVRKGDMDVDLLLNCWIRFWDISDSKKCITKNGMNIVILSPLALYLLVQMRTLKVMGTRQLGHNNNNEDNGWLDDRAKIGTQI